MPRAVTTFLMFDGGAEAAMLLYTSIFDGAFIEKIERWGPSEQGKEGSVKRGRFEITGHSLTAIDSPVKHAFTFTPATSLWVECIDEVELDLAYEKLSEGGSVLMPLGNYGFSKKFGWVNDRFGVSWQLSWS
jgi:predicted 3-demethylubiquinone-9 3-methyltransferase (glyoxalase superfamily)